MGRVELMHFKEPLTVYKAIMETLKPPIKNTTPSTKQSHSIDLIDVCHAPGCCCMIGGGADAGKGLITDIWFKPMLEGITTVWPDTVLVMAVKWRRIGGYEE